MSNLLNALSKLNQMYQQKKDTLKIEQVREAEQQQQQQQQLKEQPIKSKKEDPIVQQLVTEKKKKKKMFILRKCAGDTWEDATLADWPENDYRLFCGNLGNEVSDEILASAFRKYPSFARSRVIRDKRTMKTKGYGFVAFMNPNDYLKAFKEMNGKYVGNRPVKILKSRWQDRSYQKKKNDGLEGQFIKPKIRKIKHLNNINNNV